MKKRLESILRPVGTSNAQLIRASDTLVALSTAPASRGRKLLEKYLKGEVLTNAVAVQAKCCDCSGYYIGGLKDCNVHTCPLYPFMPFGKMRKPHYIRPERRK